MRTGLPGDDEDRIADAIPEPGGTGQQHGCYVYGIVPGGTLLAAETVTICGEHVFLVPYGDVAALVSNIGRRFARPENLVAHKQLLDQLSAQVPVLPFRFGTVLGDRDKVASLLLAPGHDTFRDALARLEGCTQYLVKGRYVEEKVYGEVLAENREAVELRDAAALVRDADAAFGLRLRLGQIVSAAITAKRTADTYAVRGAVAPCCVRSSAREPTHADDAVNLALLAKITRQADIEQALTQVAREWTGRVRLQLIGPMAPYDFAQAALTGG